MFIRVILFLIITAVILVISWRSLRNPRSHGFYRFFAFEMVFLLVFLNADMWFRDPFSLRKITSWMLLMVLLFLAVYSFYLLLKLGKPHGDFEYIATLVTTGIYGCICHPLYASLLYGGLGAFLKDPSLVGLSLTIALLAFLITIAKMEEVENLECFGAPYADYMKNTRMFIPYIF